MNKKVFIAMLILTISFLVSFYVLKIFFPQEFAMSIQNERLIQIGAFVDSNIILTRICSGITTFIIYWLFICASTKKWCLNWKELVSSIIIIIVTRLLYFYDGNIASGISTIGMFLIPVLFNKDLKARPMVFTYSVHALSQLLSLKIRSLPIFLTNINSIIAIVLTLECYLWLILFYIIFNYKKKEI